MQFGICGYASLFRVQQSSFKGEIKRDRDGNPVIQRHLFVLDADDDKNPDAVRITVPEDQEKAVQDLVHQHVEITGQVGRFNGHPFFRLQTIKPVSMKKAAGQ